MLPYLSPRQAGTTALQTAEALVAQLSGQLEWAAGQKLDNWLTAFLAQLAQATGFLQATAYVQEAPPDASLHTLHSSRQNWPLLLMASHAALPQQLRPSIRPGEGLLGQAFRSQKGKVLLSPRGFDTPACTSIGHVRPTALVLVLLGKGPNCLGVLEFNFLQPPSPQTLACLEAAAEWAANQYAGIRAQQVQAQLLAETLAKAQQLQIQEETLKRTIYELELSQSAMQAAEASLREGRAQLDALVNATNDHIVALDAELHITVCNAAFAGWAHSWFNRPNPKGLIVFDVLHESQQEAYSEALAAVMTGHPLQFETEGRSLSGDVIFSEVSLHPVMQQGRVMGAAMFRRDVTEQRKATEAIRHLNDTLEQKVEARTRELQAAYDGLQRAQAQLVQAEKLASLGQLIAGVAHEINTPLAVIKGATADLKSSLPKLVAELPTFITMLADTEREAFNRMVARGMASKPPLSSREERAFRKDVSTRAQALGIRLDASAAKELVRMGLTDGLDEFREVLISPKAENIVAMAASLAWVLAHTANIELAVSKTQKIVFALKNYARHQVDEEKVQMDVADNLETVLTIYQSQMKAGVEVVRDVEPGLPPIMGYPDELNQVWTNLIYNAMQAMKYNGKITIRIRTQAEGIVVDVADNGPGIPPDVLPRIFDAFYTTKPQGEGTGLGLAICRKILDRHQATINVDTSPKGTTFSVWLPLAHELVAVA